MGMDKHDALARFEKPDGANILLSTEVASEGVDLQFSSLLINYDLPWNPAKIEQRIGRIDRIGQQAERILIWNMVYADTIDERVQSRLMQRLDTFRNALGSMEAVLGEEIRKLGYELLSHRLTAAEERDRVDRAAVAIETRTQQELKLEEEASNLIAHGEFITNKVRAANELGRYIRGDDLLAYVRDFLKHEFEGTRLIAAAGEPLVQTAELSIDAKQAFGDFLQAHRLQSRTALLSSSRRCLGSTTRLADPNPAWKLSVRTIHSFALSANASKRQAATPGISPSQQCSLNPVPMQASRLTSMSTQSCVGLCQVRANWSGLSTLQNRCTPAGLSKAVQRSVSSTSARCKAGNGWERQENSTQRERPTFRTNAARFLNGSLKSSLSPRVAKMRIEFASTSVH
ncbi:helicase-related protein [Ottowia beijingensis]|uniref:helicase-related protein n=1 Tax=Ottowia beijingensis TaxID=1207057 RepID=UPI00214D7CD5|nr:helicase-related protein [Ottowia beijingensis]